MNRIVFLSSVFFICADYVLLASGPDSLRNYTLEQLDFLGSRYKYFQEDLKIVRFDTLQYHKFRSTDLNKLLESNSSLKIKDYGGSGSLSTLSIRGSSASQSVVLWNGFPLNSVTTAETDLSLIPVVAAQEIILVKGSSGSLYGSGSFGGAVMLENSADWDNRFFLEAGTESGSFGTFNHFANVKAGSSHFQSYTLVYLKNAKNDFQFTDIDKPGEPTETLKHNEMNSIGIMQHLFFKVNNTNQVEAGIWFQDKEKEIPSTSGSYKNSLAGQADSTLKMYAGWSKKFNSSVIKIKAGWFNDNLHYTDKLNPEDSLYYVNSRINTSSVYTDASYRYYFNRFTVDAALVFSNISAKTNNYSGTITENNLAVVIAGKYRLKNITTLASARYEFNSLINTKPIVSVGFNYFLPKENLHIRGNFSTRFRKPTFNEKYWMPVGNPDILPESGFGSEIGFDYYLFSNDYNTNRLSLLGYSYNIDNCIQWIPSGSLSYPRNTRKVWSRGLEAGLFFERKITRNITTSASFDYSMTYSTITGTYSGYEANLGSQLRYVPKHTFSVDIQGRIKSFFLSYNLNYNGEAPISEDNEDAGMPSFIISSLYGGCDLKIYQLKGSMGLRLENLFNKSYQVIRSYPMPGRAFYLSFSVRIDK